MEPRTDTPSTPPGGPTDRSRTTWALAGLAALVVALVVVLIVVLSGDDDDDDVTTEDTTTSVVDSTTTTEAEETTTTAEETTTTASPTTAPGSVTDAEAATVAWPDPLEGAGYDDPVDAASDFASEVLGFSDPIVGELQEGDARSGEVEVRAAEDGPVTTVGVRQMSDDRHYVLFAASSEVELLLPTAGSAIDAPLEVEGWGRGFEGQIAIRVHDRSDGAELGEGFVTGGGAGELEAFSGEIDWDNPGGGWGLVVAAVPGGEDGATWAATALPVGFIGGD
jgi:hypothetical protein